MRLFILYIIIDVSTIILDSLLTKRHLEKVDNVLINALACIIVLLKDHGMKEVASIIDVFKIIERKGKTEINDYEFFKLFKTTFPRNDKGEID